MPNWKPLGVEPMSGFEPPTSSLPRKRSTPELHRPKKESGRPGSNRRHSAWKADALPTELLPQFSFMKDNVGRAGFEPAKVKTNRFTVCPRWPLEYLPKTIIVKEQRADGGTRTHDLLITNQLL